MKRNNDTAARKAEILAAALVVAQASNYASMTRADIATAAGVSGPLVQHYLGTMKQLRRAVMRKAVHDVNLTVIAQGLVAGDDHARNAPEDVRLAAVSAML